MKHWIPALVPSDYGVIVILVLALALAILRLPIVGEPLLGPLLLHAALLIGFVTVVIVLDDCRQRRIVDRVRAAATVAVLFALYTGMGKLGMVAMGNRADEPLSWIDTWLCGQNPSLFLQRYQTPACIEFFSFVYAAFIPFNILLIVYHCLRLSPQRQQWFLFGLVVTYTVSHLGFLFLPTHGPGSFHARDYDIQLTGGCFYQLVQWGIAASGGYLGAFPSLHVGSSIYLCLFHVQTGKPICSLFYVPFLVLICLSTLFLRYHYVVDLVAGSVIACAALILSQSGSTRSVEGDLGCTRKSHHYPIHRQPVAHVHLLPDQVDSRVQEIDIAPQARACLLAQDNAGSRRFSPLQELGAEESGKE